jgi:CRP-like cAMP-binding protein
MTSSAASTSYGPATPRFHIVSADSDRGPATLNDHLRSLRQYGEQLQFGRDATIFHLDEPADRVFEIIKGTVRICRYTPDGRRHVGDFMLAGDLIGFLECADQPATAEAVTDVTLISYPRRCFDRIAASDLSIRKRVLCHISAELLEAQRRLFSMGCQNAKERVATFLLRFADRIDVVEGDRLVLPMGRRDIADHLGLTIETVCRAISALKNAGTILVPSTQQVILRDMAALRSMGLEV